MPDWGTLDRIKDGDRGVVSASVFADSLLGIGARAEYGHRIRRNLEAVAGASVTKPWNDRLRLSATAGIRLRF